MFCASVDTIALKKGETGKEEEEKLKNAFTIWIFQPKKKIWQRRRKQWLANEGKINTTFKYKVIKIIVF